ILLSLTPYDLDREDTGSPALTLAKISSLTSFATTGFKLNHPLKIEALIIYIETYCILRGTRPFHPSLGASNKSSFRQWGISAGTSSGVTTETEAMNTFG